MRNKLKELGFKKGDLKKIIIVLILFSLAFFIHTWSINKYTEKENIDLVHFCRDHYRNDSFVDLFYDREPFVLKSCYDKGIISDYGLNVNVAFHLNHENNREKYCPEITDEQLKFSNNCGWMDNDYFLLLLKIGGGFFLPAIMLIIAGVTINNFDDEELGEKHTDIQQPQKLQIHLNGGYDIDIKKRDN